MRTRRMTQIEIARYYQRQENERLRKKEEKDLGLKWYRPAVQPFIGAVRDEGSIPSESTVV